MMNRRSFGLCALATAIMMPALLVAGAGEIRLRANLTGAKIDNLTPSGHAEFRSRPGRASLNVQVEDVKVPVGSVLDVFLNDAKIGTITVQAVILGGELDLNTQDGDMVPSVSPGALVVVKLGDRAIVAGVF